MVCSILLPTLAGLMCMCAWVCETPVHLCLDVHACTCTPVGACVNTCACAQVTVCMCAVHMCVPL